MDYNKIGAFILKLRNDKGWSQEFLAEKIPISRQAVSKWERGKALPDSNTLLRLKDIFNVSVDEILSGERFTTKDNNLTDNVTIGVYTKYRKTKRFLKIIILLLLLFLFYFFINSYRSIHIYTIYGNSDNFTINNGIFVVTNDKLYFSISNLISNIDKKVENIELYSLDDGIKKVIASQDDNYLTIIDYKGYDEYFDTKKIKKHLNKLYIDITIEGKIETIHLLLKRDFVNDKLIFKKNEKSSTISNVSFKKKTNELNDLIEQIKAKTNYDGSSYSYEYNDEKLGTYFFSYLESTRILSLTKIEEKNIIEIWALDCEYLTLQYSSFIDSDLNFILNANMNECSNKNCHSSNKKEKEFWTIIELILNSN